jgi:hypothetical protein
MAFCYVDLGEEIIIIWEGNMKSIELEHFGALLMKRVRDITIKEMKEGLIHSRNGSISKEINRIAEEKSISEKEKLFAIIPITVDLAIHYFLWMIEEGSNLKLIYKDPETGIEVNVNEISDGLSGEIFTDEGWINRFSKAGNIDY